MRRTAASKRAAQRILVEGIVQGVGFRPFVYSLAERHRLCGWVRNTSAGVEIEAEGPAQELVAFLHGLRSDAPPLARIERIAAAQMPARGYREFAIHHSGAGDGYQPVPPDAATCPECMAEVADPANQRFAYPFTNCTNCGPRFTIIRAMPYDRPNTTMAGFRMCPSCEREYHDPGDRRFHAQPDACPRCGPRLALVRADGTEIAGEPIQEARRMLAAGAILAVKGLGGFHLACDATNDAVVARLRRRKRREMKPMAVMAADITEAEALCCFDESEKQMLTSAARPIVLGRKRPDATIAAAVAPGIGWLGVMVPYTPLHHLLLAGAHRPLVMTSGNRSEEPLCTDNDEARLRLAEIADAFLIHDRPIQIRCDDSVVRVTEGRAAILRRARGYAPAPIGLPFAGASILACGAELKNTICLTRDADAFLSPHIGDLGNYDTFSSLGEMVEHMRRLLRIRPEAIARDLHPDYLSTRYALSFDPALPRIGVQHHHAHVAACMAEHRVTGRVLGVAFDGTGYGIDGAVWGGEFLDADYADFKRVAHLAYVPMPGGEKAIREPRRMALAHLMHAGESWDAALPAVGAIGDAERRAVAAQIEKQLNAPMTSSVGRLFDAVAALIGVCGRALYEGQAAMELEACADLGAEGSYPFVIQGAAPLVIDPAPIIRAVTREVRAAMPASSIAMRFHRTVARIIAEVCIRLRAQRGLERVILSGGVFQNAILLREARRLLAEAGFAVFTHELVPPNDGGLALGQAAVALARLKESDAQRPTLRPATNGRFRRDATAAEEFIDE